MFKMMFWTLLLLTLGVTLGQNSTDDLETRVTVLEVEVANLEDEINDVEDDVGGIEADIDQLGEDVNDLEDTVIQNLNDISGILLHMIPFAFVLWIHVNMSHTSI